jgi:arylsulfatase
MLNSTNLCTKPHTGCRSFDYDGGGYGRGGTATLFVDGTQVGEGRIDATVPMLFSLDETTDLGHDTATSVTDDLEVHETTFNGRIRWIQIDTGEDAKDADNYITPEERLRIAMTRQ